MRKAESLRQSGAGRLAVQSDTISCFFLSGEVELAHDLFEVSDICFGDTLELLDQEIVTFIGAGQRYCCIRAGTVTDIDQQSDSIGYVGIAVEVVVAACITRIVALVKQQGDYIVDGDVAVFVAVAVLGNSWLEQYHLPSVAAPIEKLECCQDRELRLLDCNLVVIHVTWSEYRCITADLILVAILADYDAGNVICKPGIAVLRQMSFRLHRLPRS